MVDNIIVWLSGSYLHRTFPTREQRGARVQPRACYLTPLPFPRLKKIFIDKNITPLPLIVDSGCGNHLLRQPCATTCTSTVPPAWRVTRCVPFRTTCSLQNNFLPSRTSISPTLHQYGRFSLLALAHGPVMKLIMYNVLLTLPYQRYQSTHTDLHLPKSLRDGFFHCPSHGTFVRMLSKDIALSLFMLIQTETEISMDLQPHCVDVA